MTLLSVIQNVANETGLIAPPASVIGNSQNDVKNALALANREGESLLRKHNWQNLQLTGAFNTVASTKEYAVESDYDRFVTDTLWDATNNTKMKLSTDRSFTYLENGVVAPAGIEKRWRLQQNQIELIPTPSGIDTINYDYISNEWVLDTNGTTTYSAFQADTDTTKFPEYLLELGLKYRVRKRYGDAFQDDLDEYTRELSMAIARDKGNTKLQPDIRPTTPYNIQDGSFPAV
jgi:hypothetical protein